MPKSDFVAVPVKVGGRLSAFSTDARRDCTLHRHDDRLFRDFDMFNGDIRNIQWNFNVYCCHCQLLLHLVRSYFGNYSSEKNVSNFGDIVQLNFDHFYSSSITGTIKEPIVFGILLLWWELPITVLCILGRLWAIVITAGIFVPMEAPLDY